MRPAAERSLGRRPTPHRAARASPDWMLRQAAWAMVPPNVARCFGVARRGSCHRRAAWQSATSEATRDTAAASTTASTAKGFISGFLHCSGSGPRRCALNMSPRSAEIQTGTSPALLLAKRRARRAVPRCRRPGCDSRSGRSPRSPSSASTTPGPGGRESIRRGSDSWPRRRPRACRGAAVR